MFAIRSYALQKPPGTVAGDVMIATIAVQLDTITITPPAGWTLVRRTVSSSSKTGFYQLYTYWRVADASDASVSGYTFALSASPSSWVGAIQSFSGVDTTNPIDVENGQATAVALTHATPSVTTTGANRLIVTTHMVIAGNITGWTPPTGMTEVLEFRRGTGSPGASVELSNVLQATAGATGTKTATIAGSTGYAGATHILALRGASGGGGSNTLTINKPAGVAQNDVLIASISAGPSTVTITPPSGWTLVRRTDNINAGSGASNSLAVYSKLAGASEPASYDWTFSAGNTGAAGGIMAFSGADPVLETDSGVNTASGTSSATASVTTALANTMIITSHGLAAASTWTPPSGMTETVDATGGSAALEMNYVLQGTPGASGAKTATSSSPEVGNAHIIALRRVLGSFNAFETSTGAGAISGFIKTKVAGTTINLAIAALNAAKSAVATTFIGTVRIEVLDTSDNSGALDANGCRSTWTVIQTLPDVTFAPADNGRKNISFTQANSYPNARLRMSSPAGAPDIIGCSSDNFAIRPDKFTNVLVTDNDWETAGTGRTLDNTAMGVNISHKAGRPFTVRATAVNGDGTNTTTTTNYTGTATTTLSDCGTSPACVDTPSGTLTIGASFAAGQLTSNVATYSDVGAIAVTLVDATFANVDAADGSTAAEREIKSSATNVGRFVPDHFAVALNTPSFGTACGAGSFTYVGQPFNYATAPVITVTAQNASNGTTANYTGSLWRITNTTLTGKSYTAAGSITLDASGITGTDPLIVDTGGGTGTLTFGSGTGLLFTRSTPVAPFNADISLAINVIDADSVAYASNPARFGLASAGNGIAFDSGKAMRFGRLAIKNANGSQLVPLAVQLEAQYAVAAGAGYVFVTNKDDSCTSLANNNVQMSSFTANLSACETAISGTGTLSGGRSKLILPPPGNANNGTVLLTANLGSAASGTTCTSVGGGTVSAAGANRNYLQGNWAGVTYDTNPSARAAFGTFKGTEEVIFVRENF